MSKVSRPSPFDLELDKGATDSTHLPSALVGSEIDEVIAIDCFQSQKLIFL